MKTRFKGRRLSRAATMSLMLLIIASLALATGLGCGSSATPTPAASSSATTPQAGATSAPKAASPTPAKAASPTPAAVTETTIRIGLMPIPESLPFYVAEAEGLFKDAKVKVELVGFAAAVERDAAFQAGQIDAVLNDPISALLLGKEKSDVRIVKVAFKASAGNPMISLLAAPNSKVKTLADMKGAEVAISTNSVIEYVVDRLLGKQGLKTGDYKKTEISKIPVRLEMLTNGQIATAAMPEPFAFLAQKQGATLIASDAATGTGYSTITFRKSFLDKEGAGVKRFLDAQAKAVERINASPEKYRALLVDKAKVPAAIAETYPVPKLPAAMVPSAAEIADAVDWMKTAGLLTKDVPYDTIVDGSLIK